MLNKYINFKVLTKVHTYLKIYGEFKEEYVYQNKL